MKNVRVSLMNRAGNKRIVFIRHFICFWLLMMVSSAGHAQFSHPGIQHKKSDFERMKVGIELGQEPWASSFQKLAADAYSKYTYIVKGDPSMTEVRRGVTNNYAYEKDMAAAYQNALMWWLTDDQRHADKAIEILNTWSNLTSVGGIPLDVALYGAPMINAAELIKHSNAGWAPEDVKKFGDMLVYPGYSSTTIPQTDIDNENHTFYWGIYNGDPSRAGNQDLAAYKTMMAIGIFLDNDTIYDRAFRYVSGQKHRPDDLPYESGPKFSTTEISNNGYRILYNWRQEFSIEDYGYDGVLTNYIYENGQSQESSRDQTHAMYGVSLLSQIAEVAWNQGDDLYSLADNRILTGLEYHLRYNLSYKNAYPDQTEPWEPTVESGEFINVLSRTARNYSLKINPYLDSNFDRISRGVNITRPYWEMPLNHYKNRTKLDPEAYKWLQRARDLNIAKTGTYEVRSESFTDHPGWGALAYGRPEGCAGDPINGFSEGVPAYKLPAVNDIIEAENFDYFTTGGEGFVYHDLDTVNTGGKYRLDVGMDIDTCSEGGYMLSDLEKGEWITYSVAVPTTGLYDISIRYAATNALGKMWLSAGGRRISDELAIPFGAEHSSGINDWKDYTIGKDVILQAGVQALKIHISGEANAFVLNNFKITEGSINDCSGALSDVDPPGYITPGVNYRYYEGTWDNLPDFSQITPVSTGIHDGFSFIPGFAKDSFAMEYTGYIYIPIDGSFTFYTSSNEGSQLFIDGRPVVDNNGIHGVTEAEGSSCLKQGYHSIKVQYFEKTGEETLSVNFKGPGVSKRTISEVFATGSCDNVAVELPGDAVDGISYYYYEGDWGTIPSFASMVEKDRGITSTINLDVSPRSEYFGLVFKAYFLIDKEADYTFYVNADNGARLSIDGRPVVVNDAGRDDASGTLCLAAGYHEMEIQYFNGSGSHYLKVDYEGGSVSRKGLQGFKTKPVAGKVSQVITFNTLNKYLGEPDFDPGATASSGLPLTYTSYNEDVATIVDNKIHIEGLGQAIILASQEGNVNYKPSQAAVYLYVNSKLDQTIRFDELPVKYIGDPDFDPGAIASSGLPVVYRSYNLKVATIVDNMIHIVGKGKAIILATQEGNHMYNSAQNAVYLTVDEETPISNADFNDFVIFPNPASETLSIRRETATPVKLKIINTLGVAVITGEIGNKSESIDISHLANGLYILQLSDKQSKYVFIKQ